LSNIDGKLIFSCVAGSHLYGTATDSSDKDVRGVFIPSKKFILGFVHRVEQVENKPDDVTFYGLHKFFHLCVQCNPNIVELLFVPPHMRIVWTPEWELILNNRWWFLSTKARHTFSGYATSQLHRIKRHRSWLLDPPKKQPQRSDFGLPNDRILISKDQLNAMMTLEQNSDVEYNLDSYTIEVLQREHAYQNSLKQWTQYQQWKASRNPERAALEERYGYDTKHGSHLYRLITEGKELLLEGNITFPRPDAEFLVSIRNGELSYDQLIDLVGDLDRKFSQYEADSVLPSKPNIKSLDSLCIKLTEGSIASASGGLGW
jgi:hypothetical protein